MKKNILKTGILTVGLLSILSNDIKVYASEYKQVKSEEEQLIEDYCKVFELNEEVVFEKIKRLTGNFKYWKKSVPTVNEEKTGIEYKYIYELNDKEYYNLEVAILETVRDISKNPEYYNLTYEDINSEYEYTTNKSGEEILKYYCDLEEINEYAALPIMYEECYTDLSSDAYLYDNNPAGMGPGYSYKNIEVGIIEFVCLMKYDNLYKFDEKTDNSVYNRIGSVYCTSGTDGWISHTNEFYYGIEDNYYYYADLYERKHVDYKEKIKLH